MTYSSAGRSVLKPSGSTSNSRIATRRQDPRDRARARMPVNERTMDPMRSWVLSQ
jgi:hypothetical protein